MITKHQAFEGLEWFCRFWIAFLILGTLLVLLARFGMSPLAQKAESLLIAISEPFKVWLLSAFLLLMSGFALLFAGPRSSDAKDFRDVVFNHLVDAPLRIVISLTGAIFWVLIPVILTCAFYRDWPKVFVISWFVAQLLAINVFSMIVASSTYQEALTRWENRAIGGRLVGAVCVLGAALVFWALAVSANG